MNEILIKPEDDNVIDFQEVKTRLALAGEEPPDPTGPDWLLQLPIGTVFLIQDKKSADFNLGLFTILDKTDKSVLLGTTLNQPMRTYVNPKRFCYKYSLFELLGQIITEETKEKNLINDG